MAFPADLTTVEVRDQWFKTTGEPETGSITITPSQKFKSASTGVQFANTPAKVQLINGAMKVRLPATDDPDYTPTGFTYRVDVTLDGVPQDQYDIALPAAFASTGIDLGKAVVTVSSPGVLQPPPPQVSAGDLLPLGGLAWLLAL